MKKRTMSRVRDISQLPNWEESRCNQQQNPSHNRDDVRCFPCWMDVSKFLAETIASHHEENSCLTVDHHQNHAEGNAKMAALPNVTNLETFGKPQEFTQRFVGANDR